MKREEKIAVKQLEKNKREAEKEKMRMERELLKEKLQNVSYYCKYGYLQEVPKYDDSVCGSRVWILSILFRDY